MRRIGPILVLTLAACRPIYASEILTSIDFSVTGVFAPTLQDCTTFSMTMANLAPRPLGDILLAAWPPPFALVDGFSGAMDLTSALDSSPFFYYSQMVQSVTNGVDEPIAFWGSIQGCNRLIPNYGPFSESTLFNTPSDLVGNQIDFIRLAVNDLQIQQIGATTNFDLSVSYQFWGTPIPEPAALMPLVFCALIARRCCAR